MPREMSDVEAQIESFVAKYTPVMAAQLRDARRRARALFPRGFELVYDNYNAYVFGFGVTERASDVLVSIAGYPRRITSSTSAETRFAASGYPIPRIWNGRTYDR